MAARRIFSALVRYQSRSPAIQVAGLSSAACKLPTCWSRNRNASAPATHYHHQLASIQTQVEVESTTIEEEEGKKSDNLLLVDQQQEEEGVQQGDSKQVAVEYLAQSSGLKTSSRHDLAMVFTCKVCETRSVKTMCRESYEKGVVVAKCGGCDSLHLIADRLGWFGEAASVEDFLAARGEHVTKGSIDTLSLTPQDLAGSSTK